MRRPKKRFVPNTGVTVLVVLMVLALDALGTWQVFRLQEKTAYIEAIHASMSRPPVPLPGEVEDPKHWEFSRVTMAGKFLYDKEFLIKPRTFEGKAGYHVLVPFKRASGQVVMVNRGWVSDDTMAEIVRPQGWVKVEGIVQLPEKGAFTPENNVQRNDWYWPDVNAMADAAQVQPIAPVVVSVAERVEGQYPVGGIVSVKVANNHLHYAIFWYLMSVVLVVIYVMSQMREEEITLELEK